MLGLEKIIENNEPKKSMSAAMFVAITSFLQLQCFQLKLRILYATIMNAILISAFMVVGMFGSFQRGIKHYKVPVIIRQKANG